MSGIFVERGMCIVESHANVVHQHMFLQVHAPVSDLDLTPRF